MSASGRNRQTIVRPIWWLLSASCERLQQWALGELAAVAVAGKTCLRGRR